MNARADLKLVLKADNRGGLCTLPSSTHRDYNDFRYYAVGRTDSLLISDTLYNLFIDLFSGCLRNKVGNKCINDLTVNDVGKERLELAEVSEGVVLKEYSVNYSISSFENYRFSNVMTGGKYDKEGKINNFFLQLSALTSIKPSAVDFLKDKSLPWTREKLKEELYIQLMSIKIDGEIKYDKQARYLIYRIPISRPTPYFIINYSDLSQPIIEELSGLSNADLNAVIREVISWIYESIDKDYFLISIKRHGLIFWRIES